jgi:hypothetical protein
MGQVITRIWRWFNLKISLTLFPSARAKPPAVAPKYKYSALENNNSIRILTLYPGTPGTLLEGKLEFFRIDSVYSEHYEALSYVWGEPDRCHEISIDGPRLGLTASLHDALEKLRYTDQPRRLWVDQVCINQEDREERSQQVQFMNLIYKNANHVLVWLGRDEQLMAKSAFKLVHELDEIFQDEEKHKKFRIGHTKHLEKVSQDPWIPLRELTHLSWVS